MLTQKAKAQFAVAIRRLLRPLVRQLISYGFPHPWLNRVLKELYVEVAEQEFALPFKRQTDSRLALVTGLARKEVAALRRARKGGELVEVEDTPVTHVIGRWMAGPPFATPDGVPRPLPYESPDRSAPSFTALVRQLGVDIPPRAILDELIRTGAASLSAQGMVHLHRQAHIPLSGEDGKIALLGSDPAEVFATIVHNIERPETPWLQRKVVYDNVGGDALAEIREQVRRVGEEFVRRVNALLSSYDRDRSPAAPGGPRSRVAVGVYYFEESEGQRVSQPGGGPPGRIRRSA